MWTVTIRAAASARYQVSDGEMSGIDWGLQSDDQVEFTDAQGRVVRFRYSSVLFVECSDGTGMSPGSYQGWLLKCAQASVGGEDHSLVHSWHMTQAQKDAIVGLSGGGNPLIKFEDVTGKQIYLPSNNLSLLVLEPDTLVIDPP